MHHCSGGEVVAAASANEETILTATVSLEAVLRCMARLDVGGHYSRPDVLKLLVNRHPFERIIDTNHADSINHGAIDVRTQTLSACSHVSLTTSLQR